MVTRLSIGKRNVRLRISAILILAFSASSTAEPLQCNVGPIVKNIGGSEWQVTSCNDGRSLVFATMAGNPAMPFVFIVQRDKETAKIHGEGNGSKEYSAATFDEIRKMTAAQFDELVQATMEVIEEN